MKLFLTLVLGLASCAGGGDTFVCNPAPVAFDAGSPAVVDAGVEPVTARDVGVETNREIILACHMDPGWFWATSATECDGRLGGLPCFVGCMQVFAPEGVIIAVEPEMDCILNPGAGPGLSARCVPDCSRCTSAP